MQRYQLFIGIDISKKWIDVCLSLTGKIPEMLHYQFSNTTKGFKKMLNAINSYAKAHKIPQEHWLFCMEHTGIYVLPLCSFLQKENLAYVLQSALQIKRSLGIRRGKSDKTDAAAITRYVFLFQDEVTLSKLPSDNLLKIKHLLSYRSRLVKTRVRLKASNKDLSAFSKNAIKVKQSSNKVCKLVTQEIKQVEQEILKIIQEDDKLLLLHDLMLSIPGVGLVISAHLLVHTNGFTAFDNPRQFACYIGIAPFGHSSGSSIKQPDKVSHLANKRLKTLISNGAMSAIRWDQQIKAYYQRKIEENKNPFLVQNNVKNKLVQRIFAVVKRGTPYVKLNNFSA